MFITHEINISSEELKNITKIISQEKKLGFELTSISSTESVMISNIRYSLSFSQIDKKGGSK